MSQNLTLHYTPSQQDYANVLRIFFLQRTSTKISLAVMVIAFGLILYTIFSKGSPPTFFELIWLLMPPFFMIFVLLIQPSRIARKAAQNEQLTSEATWEVSDEGVQISSRFGSTSLAWDALDKLLATRDYYLLLNKENKNAFRFLPCRAFSSPQQQAEFKQLVESHLAKA